MELLISHFSLKLVQPDKKNFTSHPDLAVSLVYQKQRGVVDMLECVRLLDLPKILA